MYKVLLLEDQNLTREALGLLLERHFPDAEVLLAADEDQARSIIEKLPPGDQLDVVILDMKVPQKRGGNPEVSHFCGVVSDYCPGTIVAHITAHATDEDVKRHLEKYHEERIGNPSFWVKKEGDWDKRLIRDLSMYRVARQLDAVFSEPSRYGTMVPRPSGRHRGSSFRLANLTEDISCYWNHLDDGLRQRIRKDFDVIEADGKVLVGLGGEHAGPA